MAVGFPIKSTKAQIDRSLDQRIAHFVRLGKKNFPIDLMRWFAAQIDSERLGPSEDYGVPFAGNKHFSIECYEHFPRQIRAVICFDEFWDYFDPDLSPEEVLDLAKGFSIAGEALLSEAMEAIE